ncbi:hypothetical protein TCAL_10415 [Tigriopus californicus]|uniref:BHLH domain-containing protein n=2 Tax=Tigriopus californicus TaxID=6832 RepID=A0A553PL47_TIGCA|nr:hypothetical protein TCAL_10415 [Tigriopus californicus]|eukprot:TCALIF_10415-PA protein Name:"Similar to tx Helix-loop-helix protein delilah (Drosophila melanogaster)" AED:0.35 eAED:0.35 QI:0/-1/0/1/-1/1/1/0/428
MPKRTSSVLRAKAPKKVRSAKANNNSNNKTKKNYKSEEEVDKYALRACSIKKRIETESRKGQPRKRGPKPKPRPLPMSKYRRKTANLRERQRMGEINVAFDKLKDKIPTPIMAGKGRCEKLTKINVLHVAINYIRALENILDTGDAGVNVYGTSIVQSPFCPLPTGEGDDLEDEDMDTEEGDSNDPLEALSNAIKLTATINKSKKRNKSESSSNSSGDDSGFMEDADDPGDDRSPGSTPTKGLDNSPEVDCPDWTELTSTLDFLPRVVGFKSQPPPVATPSIPAPAPPTTTSGNLDTLLTISAAPVLPNKSARRVLQPKHFNQQSPEAATGSRNGVGSGGRSPQLPPPLSSSLSLIGDTSSIGAGVLNTGTTGKGSDFIGGGGGGLDPGLITSHVADLFTELAGSFDESLEGFEDFNFGVVDPFENLI